MSECGPGHDQHLCQLVSRKTPVEELKERVRGARYICKGCGRAAARAEHLCAPEEL